MGREIKPKNTPLIINKALSAGVEGSQAIPNKTCAILVMCRESKDILVAFASGETASLYFTIKSDQVWSEDGMDTNNLTLYLLSATDTTVEILYWSFV